MLAGTGTAVGALATGVSEPKPRPDSMTIKINLDTAEAIASLNELRSAAAMKPVHNPRDWMLVMHHPGRLSDAGRTRIKDSLAKHPILALYGAPLFLENGMAMHGAEPLHSPDVIYNPSRISDSELKDLKQQISECRGDSEQSFVVLEEGMTLLRIRRS